MNDIEQRVFLDDLHLMTVYLRQKSFGYRTAHEFIIHSGTRKWAEIVQKVFADMIYYVKANERYKGKRKDKAFYFSFLLSYHLGEEFLELSPDDIKKAVVDIKNKIKSEKLARSAFRLKINYAR